MALLAPAVQPDVVAEVRCAQGHVALAVCAVAGGAGAELGLAQLRA
jgi:hypothetical protein